MTYEELVASIQKTYAKADAKSIPEHVAIQVNVTGEGEGAFYIEVADGQVHVEPYEYYDRDAIISTSAENILDIVLKKGSVASMMAAGQAAVYGNVDKTMLLDEIKLKPARRTSTKKKAAAEAEDTEMPAVKKRSSAKKEAGAEQKKTATKASEVKAATGKTKRATKTAKKG